MAVQSTATMLGRQRQALPPDELLPPPGWHGMWTPADKHSVVAEWRVLLAEVARWVER